MYPMRDLRVHQGVPRESTYPSCHAVLAQPDPTRSLRPAPQVRIPFPSENSLHTGPVYALPESLTMTFDSIYDARS